VRLFRLWYLTKEIIGIQKEFLMKHEQKSLSNDLPAALGGAPVFVQTGVSQFPALDRWRQITEEEARVAYEMTLRNELSGGTPVVRQFEQEWRERIGSKYAITTMNGTSALYSAYFGVGVGPGDEVICPTYTWICTIAPVPLLGARPVFCESNPETLMADPADIRHRITERTAAIVVVHLWGNVCDMDEVMKISGETGIPVIEDCSHAHGASYKGRPVGSFGQAACWSLQGSKPTSAGEGGVIATNDTEIFERACLVGQVNRIRGLDLVTEKYAEFQPLGLGMKFRAHPLGIGIAQVQLRKLKELNARRAAYIEAVEAGLADIPGLQPVKTYPGVERGGFYGFPTLHVQEHGGLSTKAFIEALQKEGLPANDGGYPLLHTLPLFAKGFDIFTRNRGPLCGDYPGYKPGDFPITERMRERLVFLPVLSDPVPEAADSILSAIRKVAQHAEQLVKM
jgi:dTDP-4-amino-4,6-dideoxygalactose transaminase